MLLLSRLVLLLLLALAQPARAASPDIADAVSVEVLPGWRRADGTHIAALRFRLAPGWKTYWRSAGAAGIAPRMDWRGSGNVRSVTPAWPTPGIFGPVGAMSIGYDRDFVLPLLIPARGPGPVRLRGTLDIGVCREICLPARLTLAADLPATGRRDAAIEAALADRPRPVRAAARCALAPVPGGFAITATLDIGAQGGTEAVVFELPDPSVWITDAATARRGGRLTATAQILGDRGRPAMIDRGALRITVIGTRGAVETTGCAG